VAQKRSLLLFLWHFYIKKPKNDISRKERKRRKPEKQQWSKGNNSIKKKMKIDQQARRRTRRPVKNSKSTRWGKSVSEAGLEEIRQKQTNGESKRTYVSTAEHTSA